MIKNFVKTIRKHQIRTQFLPFLKNYVDQKIQYKLLSESITNRLITYAINEKRKTDRQHLLYLEAIKKLNEIHMLNTLVRNEYVLV